MIEIDGVRHENIVGHPNGGIQMKIVIAIIQPDRLEEVKSALYEKDVNLITVSEVLGHGIRR